MLNEGTLDGYGTGRMKGSQPLDGSTREQWTRNFRATQRWSHKKYKKNGKNNNNNINEW